MADPVLPVELPADADLPAVWAVALLLAGDGTPLQLLCLGNLRAAVRRRLEPRPAPSRRADLAGLLRTVRFAPVTSDLEQDLRYLAAARAFFPDTYRANLGFPPARFLTLDPDAARPLPAVTADPHAPNAVGPLGEPAAAARFVRLVETIFDLCPNVPDLTRPFAHKPCPWREMGKCRGVCDGSLSPAGYRSVLRHVVSVLADLPATRFAQTLRMRHAASALDFESAALVKSHLDDLTGLNAGPFAHARPVADFKFLVVLPDRETAHALVAGPGWTRTVARDATPDDAQGVIRHTLTFLDAGPEAADDGPGVRADTLSLLVHHLTKPRRRHRGAASGGKTTFLHGSAVTGKAVRAALAAAAPAGVAAPPDDADVRELSGLT